MNWVAEVALLTWPAVVVALCFLYGPRRGAPLSYVVAWLFLPMVSIDVPGLPAYGKYTATGIALLVLLPAIDLTSIVHLRLRWQDIPIIVWCLVPFASSLSNNLGPWDGVSASFAHFITFGVPYYVGRVYLTRAEDFAWLARVLVACALLYLPLCVYEARMSPQLHRLVYGVHGRPTFEILGSGPFAYAPTVFMNSAFEVSTLFGSACILSLHARITQVALFRWLGNAVVLGVLSLGMVLTRKWSGLIETGVGLLSVLAIQRGFLRATFLLLTTAPLLYMALFYVGESPGLEIASVVEGYSTRRGESFRTRVVTDQILLKTAKERPLLGWGGWGENRTRSGDGAKVTATDSLWMIILGTTGLVGLGALMLIYLLPVLQVLRCSRLPSTTTVPLTVIIPFVLVLLLQVMDMLFNAFPSAMYPMFSGGILTSTLRRVPR